MDTVGPIEALGTHWYIRVFEEVDSATIETHTKTLLEDFEERFSRFRPHSWLSQLNDRGIFVDPNPEFIAILCASLKYHEETDGVFNIAVGERMEKSGYDADYSFKATSELPELPNLSEVLTVSDSEIKLTNARLDLGGIGKGWAIDKLAKSLTEELGLQYFLINGGGDIYATSDNGKSIEVKLSHPTNPKQFIGRVTIKDKGFAASSPHQRTWKDPETGHEHNHLHTTAKVSAYVVAGDTTEADVLGTTLAIAPAFHPVPSVQSLIIQGSQILQSDPVFQLHREA